MVGKVTAEAALAEVALVVVRPEAVARVEVNWAMVVGAEGSMEGWVARLGASVAEGERVAAIVAVEKAVRDRGGELGSNIQRTRSCDPSCSIH